MKIIKMLIKRFFPPKWIAYIERLYYMPQIILGNRRKKKVSEKKSAEKIKIGFLVWIPGAWNSLRLLYQLCEQEDDVIPYLIVSPNQETGVSEIAYFQKNFSNVIDVQKSKDLSLLKDLDILFQQTPYDDAFPKPYRSRRTSKYTKVCYIPYGYNLSLYKHLNINYNLRFLSNAYALFVDSKEAEEFCIKKIGQQFVRPSVKVFNVGFPRFDLYKNSSQMPDTYTFLWIPRWSLDNINNDGTNFFNYKDQLIEYFLAHPNINLIIRPHPLMFDNFIECGVMTQDDVDDFLKKVNEMKNISYDENLDYMDTFNQSSAMIGDFSSLLIEFFLTGKPIIYCGDQSSFSKEALEISQSFYDGGSWEALLQNIESLANGLDPEKAKRDELRDVFLHGVPDNSSKNILDQCRKL